VLLLRAVAVDVNHEACKHLGIKLAVNSTKPSPYRINSPKVILLDTGNSIHPTNFSSHTNQLDPNMRSDFDDRVFVVRELWGCRVGVKFDVRRYKLVALSAAALSSNLRTYM
jgi:hypothetical protein